MLEGQHGGWPAQAGHWTVGAAGAREGADFTGRPAAGLALSHTRPGACPPPLTAADDAITSTPTAGLPPCPLRCPSHTPDLAPDATLFIVLNAGSAKHAPAPVQRRGRAGLRRDGAATTTSSCVEAPGQLQAFAREAVERARANGGIVVAGGDGTINAVAQATLGSGCVFGVLPQGTFNYFSRTHGIPAENEAALRRAAGRAAACGAGRPGERQGVPRNCEPGPLRAVAGRARGLQARLRPQPADRTSARPW